MLKGIIRKIRNTTQKKKASQDKWEQFLSEKAGITYEEARARLDFVKKDFGISPKQYCTNKYYELSESAMATKVLKDQRRSALKQERFGIMESLSGKGKKQISDELSVIRSTSGADFVNFRWYFDNGLYALDPVKDRTKIEGLIRKGERKNALRREIIDTFSRIDSGEESYENLEESLSEYRRLVEETLSEARTSQLADIIKDAAQPADEKELKALAVDMEITDKLLDFLPQEYLGFHFWDKTIPERREFVSSRLRDKIIRKLNTKEGIEILDSKYDTYLRLKPFYRRELALLDMQDRYELFRAFCSRHTVFVKKNNYDSVGRGIQKIDLSSGEPDEIYREVIGEAGQVLLEELIKPSEEIRRINPDSVNTVRIIVFEKDGEYTVEDTFMKIGRKGSFVDNGGAGGIFVHVDPETGVFDSSGIDEKCIRYETHPDHGYRFEGIALPDWEEALKTARAASAEIPEARYIGWDLTYTDKKEWIIVEGNSRTQFFGQQMTIDRGIKKKFIESVGPDVMAALHDDTAEIVREIEEKFDVPADDITAGIHRFEELGMNADIYKRYRGWELTEDERIVLKEELDKRAEISAARELEVADFIAKKTGLDAGDVLRKYQLASQNGYKEYWFIIDGIYLLSDEEILAHKNLRDTAFSDDWHEDRSKRYRQKRNAIKAQKGWNRAQQKLAFLKARNSCGCASDEYMVYGIWDMNEEEAKKLLTAAVKRKAWLLNASTFERSRIFQDKILFSEVFSEYTNRICFPNRGLSYEEFVSAISGTDRVVYKLREGEKGIGMRTFDVNAGEEQNREVYRELCGLAPGIVEEYLKQDEEIASFYPDSVNTIRVMTSLRNGKADIVMAALRTGTSGTVDNWSQGGISASIDPETGIIATDGADYLGDRYVEHPYGGKKFRGFQIPHWDSVRECVCNAALKVPDMPFIGWDVAILNDGRVALIEGNPDFGIKAVQTPYALDGIGLRERFESFL